MSTTLTPDPLMTDERRAFVDALEDFAHRECGSREQRDRLTGGGVETHSRELYAKLSALGWVGCCLPEAYGGTGGGVVDMCILNEQIALGRMPLFAIGTSLIVAKAVEKNGSEEQRERIIGDVCAGGVASIAMSEPGAGSDVAAMACRARKVDGGWLINGQKTWISSAQHASRILLICRTSDGDRPHAGLSMLDVPMPNDGVEVHAISTLGGREVNDVFFTDCFVDDDALIGEEGRGWNQLMNGLNFERLLVAASMLGHAKLAFEDALSFVKERRQFGQPVGQFQTIRHRLADLATEIECCRLLVYDIARRADEQPDVQMPREASMAKLKLSETARRVALEGMQMMGGCGYSTEYEMEHHVRIALASTIYGGTSEVQREIIGRSLGL